VTEDGHVATNAYVVEGCDEPKVIRGAAAAAARVLARDTKNDLALLQVDITADHVARVRAGVEVGEGVAALAGLQDDSGKIQITAQIQPGNSGGPIVDGAGNVVGVAVSGLPTHSKGTAQDVGFVIKAEVLTAFMFAHGVAYSTVASDRPLRNVELAEAARRILVLISWEG